MIAETELKRRLESIGFTLTDGYEKRYSFGWGGGLVTVDLSKPNYPITYPKDLKVWDKTTSNLSKEESSVVLQCVTKLLTLGYSPKNIELEKPYELGTREKGKLDIFIKDNEGNPYCLIECKTTQTFQKTWADMMKEHGPKYQLFSYYQQEKNSQVLVLYTYDFSENKTEYHLITPNQFMKEAGNLEGVIEVWDKSSSRIGLFDPPPYDSNFNIELKRKDLQELTEATGKGIYHQFATILRKHSISDKSNAFNKLFNLFLCKIIDEDKTEGVLDFQWKKGDKEKDLAKRLNDLYKKGMAKFLDTQITDYSDEDFENYRNDPQLLEKIENLRLYKNNEFSFIEVFNEESFIENMKVVIDVVKLLEPYQFRYTHKQQYLGDFFELLLNTGFKQENGQFFTPIPLAEFIVRSLPLKEMILENEDLPYMIDYACGSGHFLTEGMDEVQSLLEKEGKNLFPKSKSQQNKLKAWLSDSYSWANEYVYGIEHDYRLVKTTKVACFLNGDGEANILHANGLYRFNHPHYKGKLQKPNQFDILLANPPYSVDGFLSKLDKEDIASFSMRDVARTNPHTDDIECFFIERTSMLLKEGGIMGIILPITILNSSSTSLYYESLRILIRDFDIKALVDVGSKGFMATGTSTVIIFAQKRKASFVPNLVKIIEQFFLDKKDVVANGISNAFSTYVRETYEETSFEDFRDELSSFSPSRIERETARLLDFILTYPQILPVIKSGSDSKTAQKFLGYKFSKRRGLEGMHLLEEMKLYSKESKEFKYDKANTYVYKSFLRELDLDSSIHEELKDHIFITRLSKLLSWANESDWRSLRLRNKRIVSQYNLVNFSSLVCFISGDRPKGGVFEYQSGAISLGGKQISRKGKLTLENIPYVPEEFYNQYPKAHVKENDILLCKDGALTGKVAFVRKKDFPQEKIMINEHLYILRSNSDVLLTRYLFYYLYTEGLFSYIQSISQKSAQEGLNTSNLNSIPIPLPSKNEQEDIVSLMEEQERLIEETEEETNEIQERIKSIDFSNYPQKSVSDVMILEYGISLPERDRNKGNFSVVGSNGIIGDHNSYLLDSPSIIVGRKGSAGEVNWYNEPVTPIDTTFYVKPINGNNMKYLFHILKLLNLPQYKAGLGSAGINREKIYGLKVPFPSLEEQEKIVSQIEEQESLIVKYKEKIQRAKDQQKAIMNKVFSVEED